MPDQTQHGWRIERTINIGELLTVGTIAASIVFGYATLQGRQDALEQRTAKIETDVGKVSEANSAMFAKLAGMEASVANLSELLRGPIREELREARLAAERSYRHALGERESGDRLTPRR